MGAEEYIVLVFTLFSPVVSGITQLGGLAKSSVFWNALSYPEVLREDYKILRVHAVLKISEMSNIILFKLD